LCFDFFAVETWLHLCIIMSDQHNIHLGRAGEQIAVDYLIGQGYHIAERNYRAGRGEIDIIAWSGDQLLVFVEVKTRAYEAYGGPEEAVTPTKQRVLIRTAGAYMESIGYEWAVRFDVVAILIQDGKEPVVRHHEDAFF
jgi:putative endonuclease